MAPGWYGKLPAVGDFASRRLDGDWIARWDAWLAGGLLALRCAAPERWLADYLAMPTWRFALAPGALPGDHAWRVGVLMPSVDRVGRYFPLTVVSAPLPGLSTAGEWPARWEAAAQAALQHDWSAEQFDTVLSAFDGNAAAAAATQPALAHGESLWWHAATGVGRPRVGLPAGRHFERLFRPWSAHDVDDRLDP